MNQKTLLSLALAPLALVACAGTDLTLDGDVKVESYALGHGPVLIEEFSDFQCPACAAVSPLVKAYAQENLDLVTFEYNHFPLSQHREAIPAAVAAECAGEQGDFWGYEELLFQNQPRLGDDLYMEIAKELNLNESEFQTCLENDTIKKKVLVNAQEGRQRGVNSTPTLFVSVSGEEPEKVNFGPQFFEFVEQKAEQVRASGSNTPSAPELESEPETIVEPIEQDEAMENGEEESEL